MAGSEEEGSKKQGSRSANIALEDDNPAQRPNLNILIYQVANLLLPQHILLEILLVTLRAREVCKAWELFLRPFVFNMMIQIMDKNIIKGCITEFVLREPDLKWRRITGCPWTFLSGVGLGYQLVEKGVFTLPHFTDRLFDTIDKTVETHFGSRGGTRYKRVMTLVKEVLPLPAWPGEHSHIQHVRFPDRTTLWRYLNPKCKTTIRLSAREIASVARKTHMPESLIEQAINNILSHKRCINPLRLGIELVCAGLPLRLVKQFKISPDHATFNFCTPDQIHTLDMRDFTPGYILEAGALFPNLLECLALITNPAHLDFELVVCLMKHGKLSYPTRQTLLATVLKDHYLGRRSLEIERVIGRNLKHLSLSSYEVRLMCDHAQAFPLCARFLCRPGVQEPHFKTQIWLVGRPFLMFLCGSQRAGLGECLLNSTETPGPMMLQCLISCSQKSWRNFELCMWIFYDGDKRKLRDLDWSTLRASVTAPNPLDWHGKMKYLLLLYPNAGSMNLRVQTCWW